MKYCPICIGISKNVSQTSPNPRKIPFSLLNVIKTFPMPPDRAWKKMKSPSSSSASSSSEECRNWLELPRDVTVSILQRLGTIEILETAQKVCMLWRNISKDPSMWNSIDMRNHDMDYDLEKMCIHAIDRSCGHLQDINIEYFGTDKLLAYITQSSSQLRRLRLVCCYSILDEGLSKVAAKLSLLEELDITLCSLSKESLEVVGRCCPLLKSFKWNQQWYATGLSQTECDEEAVAIAKNMPELRRLQLIGNQLTNDGLQAILDGCPHLESLDLRKCFNVTLSGNLGRICAERIKNLRHPNDSTDDYGFVADDGSFDEGLDIVYSLDFTEDDEVVDDIHDDGSFDDDSDYDPTDLY